MLLLNDHCAREPHVSNDTYRCKPTMQNRCAFFALIFHKPAPSSRLLLCLQTEADLLDYDDEEAADEQANETAVEGGAKKNTGAYVSMHSSGFRDFLLKPELMKAIVDCGFEHPSAGTFLFSLYPADLNALRCSCLRASSMYWNA